jgi:SRSO17 transposase
VTALIDRAAAAARAFFRREARLRARHYLLGLVSGLERKNGWTLAEFAGDATPAGMQRLLSAARWDQDAVRDSLARHEAVRAGDQSGVQRQYTGTAGKITNCQVGVFLAYAVPGSGVRALVDRELYVLRSWTEDEQRCAAAGMPEDNQFATKPLLAPKMIERAMTSGLPFSWFSRPPPAGYPAAGPVTVTGPQRGWSRWRRCHQARARTCHYQRRRERGHI